jgi:hypothetical protein
MLLCGGCVRRESGPEESNSALRGAPCCSLQFVLQLYSVPPCSLPLEGRVGEGGRQRRWRSHFQRLTNRVDHAAHVFIDLVIPEANHSVAAFGEPSGPPCIMLGSGRFEMLRAVEFNDEPLREADEVDDVGAECGLAAELVAVELAGA